MLNVGQLGLAAMNEHMMQKLGWQMANLPIETANAFANWYLCYASAFPESAEKMRALLEMAPGRIQDMSAIPRGKGPIVVIGSGSSFNEIGPTLKDWPGAVMCSTSQASTMVKYGRAPDYVVCLDPRDAPQDELSASDWGDAVLLGHVSIPHTYVVRWLERARGNIYLGRIMEPTYDWYSHHLGRGYPWIRHIIMPMIDSGAAEISFATWLGYSPIYLAGIDYSGPRFDRWDWNMDTKEWSLDAVTSKVDMGKIGGHAEHAMSYASRGSLISSFMQIANWKYQQRIYQLSDRSLLTQFPRREWSDILAGREYEEFDRQKVLDELEMALAIWDTFMVSLNGGWGPDYHTYISADANEDQISHLQRDAIELMQSYGARPEEANYFGALYGYNHQVKKNIEDFQRIEAEHKQPVQEMIAQGLITVEAGDLLLHGAEEFQTWDWHKIKLIDIPATLQRRRWLLAEAVKRGYTKAPMVPVKDMQPGDVLAPEITQVVEMNKGSPEEKVREAFVEATNALKEREAQGG